MLWDCNCRLDLDNTITLVSVLGNTCVHLQKKYHRVSQKKVTKRMEQRCTGHPPVAGTPRVWKLFLVVSFTMTKQVKHFQVILIGEFFSVSYFIGTPCTYGTKDMHIWGGGRGDSVAKKKEKCFFKVWMLDEDPHQSTCQLVNGYQGLYNCSSRNISPSSTNSQFTQIPSYQWATILRFPVFCLTLSVRKVLNIAKGITDPRVEFCLPK